jgi:glycosyltransferase involved in cell wall biosynthesis
VRVLWFSHFVPFPPRGGSYQRSYNLIREVASSHEIHLVAFNMPARGAAELETARRELLKICASVEIWPLPIRWKGLRWWAEMTVSPMRSAPIGPRAFWSDELGRRLRGFVDSLRPDVIHVDSVDLGLFEPVLRDHRKVLNHHNCESAMAWRRARTESNPVKKGYLGSQARKIEALERRVGGAFDVHTVVSAEDGALLHEVVPQAHVHVVENGTDLRYFHPSDSAPAPGTLIFAGSLSWYPNQSGLRYFLDEVWPIIREDAPESKLTVAVLPNGSAPGSNKMAASHSSPTRRTFDRTSGAHPSSSARSSTGAARG